MRPLFRIALFLLLAFMFQTPLRRIYQTSQHLIAFTTKAATTTRTMSSSNRPTGLIANSGIELLTFGTPNGHKASILLEELKAAYGKEYVYQSINIMENIQKEDWFIKVGFITYRLCAMTNSLSTLLMVESRLLSIMTVMASRSLRVRRFWRI